MGIALLVGAAILALGRLANYTSNNVVGCALADSDRGVRTLAEQAISRLWMRVGAAADQRMLVAIEEQLDDRDYDQAAKLAAKLIQQTPWIAQAWYQRGVAYYHLGQFDAAVRGLPSGVGNQRLPFSSCLDHGARVSRPRQSAFRLGIFPPHAAAQSQHGRSPRSGDSLTADAEAG